MRLEEDLKSVRYIRERVDLIVNEEGFVILPAWQFVLLVEEYKSYRQSTFAWLGMFVLLAIMAIFFPMMWR